MKNKDASYGAQLTQFLMRWHLLEAQTDFSHLGGLNLIDMNLSGQEVSGKPFATHKNALKTIDELASNIPSNSPPYLTQKVGAYYAYLSAFLDKKPNYAQVFKKVNGYEPYLFSDDQINEQIELTKESLAELKINSPLIDVEKTLAKKHPTPSKSEDLFDLFKNTQKNYQKVLENTLGTAANFSINYQLSEPEAFYIAYITGNGNHYDMYLNPKEFERFCISEAIDTAIHEVSGHAVNFNLIKQKLVPNSGLAITTTIEPLTFGVEGLALSLENMLPELQKMPLIKKAMTHFTLTNRMAMSNARLQLNNGNMSFDNALDYANTHTPFRDRAFLETQLKTFYNHTLARQLYSNIYGHAESTWHDIATKINTLPDNQKLETRSAFLKQVYTNFTTAADIKPWQKNST